MFDNMTEADYLDDGGDYVDWDSDYFESEEEFELNLVRKVRESQLHGKYLITTKSRHNGKTLYLQDRKISSNGWWTYFKSNALGFDTKQGATKIADRLKYNKPRVIYNA